MALRLIDTHTHLFAEQFDVDRETVVNAAIGQGVERMYLPNIDSLTTAAMNALAQTFPEHCFPMMGIHPCHVKDNYKDELHHAEQELFNGEIKYHGVGETGLDYYWDKTHIELQKLSLREHAKWAKALDLPIILHTRDSFDDTLEIMQEEQDGRLKGIFHCFGGSVEDAKKVIDLGFKVGIGGVLTFKNSGASVRETVAELPIESILLETDSPYLAPHPNRGKRNETAFITLVAEKIAEVRDMDVAELAEITSANAEALFPKV